MRLQASPTLVLFDIGNTAIKVGLADDDAVRDAYTLRTDPGQTADSFGLTLAGLLTYMGIAPGVLRACVCSSVVPGMTPLARAACQRFVGVPFFEAPRDIPVPLENRYSRPAEVGSDRLVGAYAARRLFPDAPSLIVVDFGTATTFDCITDHAYCGGLIFPGVHTAAAALSVSAARLPRVSLEITDTEPVPGRDTASSIQHGIVFGFACMVEGLTARLARQLPAPVTVIGTGGFARDIARVTSCLHHIVPDLLLDGLRQLYCNHHNAQGERP